MGCAFGATTAPLGVLPGAAVRRRKHAQAKVTLGYPRAPVRATTNPRRFRSVTAPRLLGLAVFLCSIVPIEDAWAETAEDMAPLIRANTDCPGPLAVQAEVFRMTSPERRAEFLAGSTVRIVDAGDSYRVELEKGTHRFSKTYQDPARECDKRVRFVAVYVVMALMPLELNDEASPEPEQEPAEGAPSERRPPAPTEPAQAAERTSPARQGRVSSQKQEPSAGRQGESSHFMGLWLGGTVEHSVSSSEVPRIAILGAELGATLGSGRVSPALALGAAPQVDFDVGETRVKLSEWSSRAGLHIRTRSRPIALASDLGLLGVWSRVEGDFTGARAAQTRFLLGVHLSIGATVAAWKVLSPVLSLRASFLPSPSDLVVVPSGTIAHLPTLWVGALLGMQLNP